jgi:hypothetical protein
MALSSSAAAASARVSPSRGSLEDGARMPITPTGTGIAALSLRLTPAVVSSLPRRALTELHRDGQAHGFARASAQA